MARSAAAGWVGNVGVGAFLGVLLLAGCSSDQLGDRGGKEGATPDRVGDVDYVEVFRNADNFPNIARICIEGLAFASTSSGTRNEGGVANPALLRIPEWDAKCRGYARPGALPETTAPPTPLG